MKAWKYKQAHLNVWEDLPPLSLSYSNLNRKERCTNILVSQIVSWCNCTYSMDYIHISFKVKF